MVNITKIVLDYQAGLITWHDIQDMIAAIALNEHWTAEKENNILQEIEEEIKKGGE